MHSLFKLPVPILDTSTCNVKQTSSHAAMPLSMSLIIIDEASMMPLHALHAFDKLLRDLTNEDIAFGGKNFLAWWRFPASSAGDTACLTYNNCRKLP